MLVENTLAALYGIVFIEKHCAPRASGAFFKETLRVRENFGHFGSLDRGPKGPTLVENTLAALYGIVFIEKHCAPRASGSFFKETLRVRDEYFVPFGSLDRGPKGPMLVENTLAALYVIVFIEKHCAPRASGSFFKETLRVRENCDNNKAADTNELMNK